MLTSAMFFKLKQNHCLKLKYLVNMSFMLCCACNVKICMEIFFRTWKDDSGMTAS